MSERHSHSAGPSAKRRSHSGHTTSSTAQIPTEYGYDATHTNVSFVGWGPVDDPRFMVYIWLNSPSTSIWSSETAAPVFSEVAEQTVIMLNIPPDSVRGQIVNK